MPKKKSVGRLIPHTHWDREWRYPIWKTRMMLVEFMDDLLATLERDPEYRGFLMDGQCVTIEDYLEVRPENRERVCRQVRAGRLEIGPWYTLPDLYPVDAECLVRNLLRGIRLADSYGGHMHIGYNSFGWGQTAQFPQIYSQFGMNFVVAAKRVSEERAPESEYLWEAPDGTRLAATRMGRCTRANFFVNGYIPVRYGMTYGDPKFYWNSKREGLVIHNCAPDKCHEDFFKLDEVETYHTEWLKHALEASWKDVEMTTVPEWRLLLSGCDFTKCQPELTRIIADLNRQSKDIQVVHSTLKEYVDGLLERLDTNNLRVVQGELRDGPAFMCSGNALASRNYIKIRNKHAQNLLARTAEPVLCMLAALGAEYPRGMLDLAWKNILQSHAHDSINGVTQDKTADDSLQRLNQTVEIAEVLTEKAMEELARGLDLSGFAQGSMLLLVANPSLHPRHEIRRLGIETPGDLCVWKFALQEMDGSRLPVQTVSREAQVSPVQDLSSRPWPYQHDRHIVYADLGEIPAGGYKLLQVVPVANFERDAQWWPPMRTSPGGDLSPAPATLENRFLRAEVQPNGTVKLLDKQTGAEYPDLLSFEDAGDAGDYWAYYPPYRNEVHTSLGCQARIWTVDNGPLAASIAIEIIMRVPAAGDRAEAGVTGPSRRHAELVDLKVTTWLTLTRDARALEARTVVHNTARDHRLRVLLPTGIQAATTSCAGGHFTVDERPVEPRREAGNNEFWPEMQTLPTQRFVDVSDGSRGLAVLHKCFTEFEVMRDGRRTLAMTLFRSVKNRIVTEYRAGGVFLEQPGSHSLCTMEFSYAIMPHAGDWAAADVHRAEENLFIVPPVYQITAREAGGRLPAAAAGMFSLDAPGLVVSALKLAEDRDSFILRLYNPTDVKVKGSLETGFDLETAWAVNLNEERGNKLAVKNARRVAVEAGAKKIVSIELCRAGS